MHHVRPGRVMVCYQWKSVTTVSGNLNAAGVIRLGPGLGVTDMMNIST
jgi:hypothetical protein